MFSTPWPLTHHTQCRQLIYVLHWRAAEEKVLWSPPPRHTHIKGFTYSTHWAKGFKLHPYANGLRAVGVRRGQGANSECLCMGDDKKYSVTSDLQKKIFPLLPSGPKYQLSNYFCTLSQSQRKDWLFFFFFAPSSFISERINEMFQNLIFSNCVM